MTVPKTQHVHRVVGFMNQIKYAIHSLEDRQLLYFGIGRLGQMTASVGNFWLRLLADSLG